MQQHHKILAGCGLIVLVASLALAQEQATKIIPVTSWPRVLELPGKQVVNPTAEQCVKAGYRILVGRPDTPAGKQIATEKIIQDPKDASKCVWEITYKDIPKPPPPEVLTNVSADKVQFTFTDKGEYRGCALIGKTE